MTETIRAAGRVELIAHIPAMLGFRPKSSVVCVTFQANMSMSAFRLDLPRRRRTADFRTTAMGVVSILSRMRDIDQVALLIYTDDTFEHEQGIPWLEFGRMLATRVHGAGFHLLDALCVAGDGWGGYHDERGDGTPHSLADFEGLVRPELLDGVTDQVAALALPEPQPERAEALLEVISAFREPESPALLELVERLSEHAELEPCAWAQLCIDLKYDLPDEVAGFLLMLAQSPPSRDTMMLRFAFTRKVGAMAARTNERYARIQRRTGEPMDEIVQRGRAHRTGAEPLGEIMTGRTTSRPNRTQTRAAIALLRQLVADAPMAMRPGPLCMMSWMSWAIGAGSAAGAYADAALEIDPDYGMALLMLTMLQNGLMAEWYFEDSASKHQNATLSG